ncbi:endo-1,4-beta-xylanase 5-like [Pistacia vera]|uniref:endo-1,4-beta-xylanase 5-like n=1 Tax=Pistacia vera TaxID=55513 RepID=UPI001263A9A3|nr:endo-1,4-beta-xylanase 5-like [Pistacia vera]
MVDRLCKLFDDGNSAQLTLFADNDLITFNDAVFVDQPLRYVQKGKEQKKHKSRVRIQTVDDNGYPVVNVNVTIEQNPASRLPIGCATSKLILENEKYKQWFTSSFGLTTFANEMKWYNTEPSPDIENYSVPDSMLQLMKQNKILVHGHNIFTDDPKYLPSWFSWTAKNLRDQASTPSKYIKKLKEIQSYIGKGSGMAIGLQSHFDVPNLPYMRAAIDTLALAGVPIWLTELDVPSGINQAEYLEQILKEAHSHPNVEGIILWAPWSLECYGGMCLTDRDFNNLPTGDAVDRLFCDYWSSKKLEGKTDKNGNFETSIFHGDYKPKPGRYGSFKGRSPGGKLDNGMMELRRTASAVM